MQLSRRHAIIGATALVGTAVAARAQQLVPTSSQDLGPFYPVLRPRDSDADLTRVRGARGTVRGTPINVVGRILDRRDNPVRGATIELWQANAVGRYDHPGDTRSAGALDPNFQGYAAITTDRDGNFKFRTIKPGAYKIPGDMRTPHIHLDIKGRSGRLVTQMYFPGEPLNDSDLLLRNASPKQSVIARAIDRLSGDPGAAAYGWDVVLAVG
ncbi:MAG: protocatechuate 3,4-dioxygenase [Sphingomonas bacterium]|nr:protocatechuate 3,4-dioxygenase [Sphingomonas bacterium]